MKTLAALATTLLLSGCAIGSAASTAVGVATLPVKVVSKTVDLATTSQSEADEKRGRELRKQDERRAREERRLAQRCRSGKLLPGDQCGTLQVR